MAKQARRRARVSPIELVDPRSKRPEDRAQRRNITLTPDDLQIIDELGKRWDKTGLVDILRVAIRVAQKSNS